MKILPLLTLALGLLGAGPALAHDYTVGTLKIDHPWTRATPRAAPVGGGFLTVTNTGTTDDRLVSVSAAVSKTVEIHEMAVVDGVMRMRGLAGGLVIPAGATVALAPGGLHVMFIDLAAPFEAGQSFKGTLNFEKAGPVEVEFMVEAMTTRSMDHGASGHAPMDHGTMKH